MATLIDLLQMFSAGSANDESNKHLWVKGASLFINQLNNLINITTGHNLKIIQLSDYNDATHLELKKIFTKYGSDKSSVHNYHIVYSNILNKLGRPNLLNILEIGLGTNNPSLVSTMGLSGRPGASLKAFHEYLPNSQIYGADIDKDILFTSDRIKTCFVDQLNLDSFDNIISSFGNIKYDLIIDDGLHSIGANFNTLLFALKNLNSNGWFVVEDISIYNINNWISIDYILSNNKKYKTYVAKALNSYMYIIHKIPVVPELFDSIKIEF
jgi:hypothetical protein